jgi:oxygen-independent coproporphyrinogen-3 oxidase
VPAVGQTGLLVDALVRELAVYAARGTVGPFDTVFVGGGTPTVLPADELRRLLGALQQHTVAVGDVEFTVEANPATVTPATADLLVAAGVNRVSLGAQSFDPAELRVLDRAHAPEDVPRTVQTCRAAGIRQLSLDLIFGIPGQTPASWAASLAAALALAPDHLSCYGLTYEPDTPLRARRDAGLVHPVDEDLEAELFERTIDTLAAAGFEQYEISNFARPGSRCRHNLRYWRNEPYLGLGPSAAGFIDEVRYKNVADTAAYTAAVAEGRSPRCEEETLPPQRRARETAVLELRLIEGIDRRRFSARYGIDPVALFGDALTRHTANGLLVVTGTHVRLTRRGLLCANVVMADVV